MESTAVPAVPAVPASPEELAEARAWLKDCSWSNMDAEDLDALTDAEVYFALKRYFGWREFRLLIGPPRVDIEVFATVQTGDRADLTLYEITTNLSTAEEGVHLALGRDAARQIEEDLGCNQGVTTVTTEALPWGGAAENEVIAWRHMNGVDLHTPVFAVAEQRGVTFDPLIADPASLLMRMRLAS